MFKNVGNKIKKDVERTFGFSVALYVIGGIGITIAVSVMQNFFVGLLAGGIFAGIGILVAWHASFKNFAFGQMVENTDIIVEQLDIIIQNNGLNINEQKAKSNVNENTQEEVKRFNDFETENTDLNYCPNCGELQAANKNYCEICGCKIK